MLTRIVPGNQVKLTFTAKEAISNVNVTIQGQSATVTTSDNINFTAVATLNQGAAPGAVSFAISYKQQNGNDGFTNTSTTDSTGLVLVDESDVIRNLPAIATLIDSTVGRTASVTATQVNNLTDANLGTISDFRTGATNTGVGSYITFDFKAGNQVNLSSVEMVARQDSNYARIKGTVIQGSNDNTNWTTLTNQAASTMAWQTLAINNAVPYRYIRVYNSGTWFGNMAELRLHGSVHGADVTPPTTADNAPQGWTNKDTTVTLNATDSGSSIAGTYFKVDGGAQQTGNVVLIGTEGTHTITYWSADVAGNVEQQHNVSVKIDKTAPTTTGTPSPTVPASGWYTGPVSVTLAASDTASGVASTWYTIDGSAPQLGNSLALGTKGKHMVTFWSIDQAGTVETQHSLSVNIGPIDVTNHVKLTQQGATLNRATGKYVGAVTVTNIGTTALGGIVWLKLDGLTSGVTLDNAGGLDGGAPYVVVSGSLNPGATINVPLTFSNPSRGLISYTPSFLATNS
jgi:hypothetical protein